MSQENTQDLGFEERYQKDIKRRESFFSDFHIVDFANWLGAKDTDELQTRGFVLYIADGYIVEYVLRYFSRQCTVIEDNLYYIMIIKFMHGFKVLVFEYSYDKQIEVSVPDCSIFEKSIADINSLISSLYHISITLGHVFYNITEYYLKYISNYK